VAIVGRGVVTVIGVTVVTGPGPQEGRGGGVGGRGAVGAPKGPKRGPSALQWTSERGSGWGPRGQSKLERKMESNNGGPKKGSRGARKRPERRPQRRPQRRPKKV
jgi:hypothetical protein